MNINENIGPLLYAGRPLLAAIINVTGKVAKLQEVNASELLQLADRARAFADITEAFRNVVLQANAFDRTQKNQPDEERDGNN